VLSEVIIADKGSFKLLVFNRPMKLLSVFRVSGSKIITFNNLYVCSNMWEVCWIVNLATSQQ
jgi:hypothetical protein